jgi:hypothetical protein
MTTNSFASLAILSILTGPWMSALEENHRSCAAAGCKNAGLPQTQPMSSLNMSEKKTTPDLDVQFRDAAQEYWRVREDFKRVDEQLKTLAMESEDDRATLRAA